MPHSIELASGAALLTVFREEAAEHLAAVERQLLDLDRGGLQADTVRALFVHVHSLKGGAALACLPPAESLAHAMEDLLAQLRDGERAVELGDVDLLLRGVDALRQSIWGGPDPDHTLQRDLARAAGLVDAPVGRQGSPASRGRVLVVDTSGVVRERCASRLRAAGLDVVVAGDGVEALALALRSVFDLIVTGLELPGLHGLDLLAALRATSLRRDQAVVVMSCGDQAEPKAQVLAHGALACLGKDQAGLSALIETARSVVARKSPSASASSPEAARPVGHGEPVLVVEDSFVNRWHASRLLTELGYRPVVAETGAAALVAARSERFRALLVDCNLPDMDGVALMETLRTGEPDASYHPLTRAL